MGKDVANLGTNTRERLEYLEWRLFWEGQFNRSDVMSQFGVSKPQVSVDLRHYREVAVENLKYDSTKKRYSPAPKMKPKLLRVSASRLLVQLKALSDGVITRETVWFKDLPDYAVLPDLRASVSASVLRQVLRAIRGKRSVTIVYSSMSGVSERKIAPHALGYDGSRWHARAWCYKHLEFRDFVLTRIERTQKTERCDINPEEDEEWNNSIELILHPNPNLSRENQAAVAKDYGMDDGRKILSVRKALVFYLIQNLDLDLDGLPPKRSQVRLLNRDDVFDQLGLEAKEYELVS